MPKDQAGVCLKWWLLQEFDSKRGKIIPEGNDIEEQLKKITGIVLLIPADFDEKKAIQEYLKKNI
jgi:hypothetical protein